MKYMKITIGLLFIILTACSIDIFGLFQSKSDVDTRFKESKSLSPISNITIIDTNFSFIVVADSHIYKGTNRNLDRLKNSITADDKFVLLAGDLTQCGDNEDYAALIKYLKALGIPYYPVIGNHDVYFDGWNNSKKYLGRNCYTLAAGNIRLIALDSANGTLGREQRIWLENTLINKTEKYCVVFTHFEMFSASAANIQQYTDIEEIYYLMHLFEQNNVNYVFMGHSHRYDSREVNGVRYVVAGDCVDMLVRKKFVRVNLSDGVFTHGEEKFID